MKMEYRLLCDKTGVILTREPEIVSDELLIAFSGALDGYTAIFERDDGDSMYRQIKDENCSVSAAFLRGSIKVTVANLDGSVKPKKWLCEGIKAVRLKNVGVLISPDDANLQNKVVKLQIGYAELKGKSDKQEQKISELETKLNKLLEGYDIV